MTKEKPETKPPYANNLRRLIKASGMNQAQFAKKMGWNEADVSRKTNGLNSVTPPQLEEIKEKTGWTASDIYDRDPVIVPNESSAPKREMQSARAQLDTAISLWANDGDEHSVRGLAKNSYDDIQKILQERNSNTKRNIREDYHDDNPLSAELLIFGSIVGLQLLGEKLSDNEISFYRWYLVQGSKLLSKDGRAMLMELSPVSNISDIKNLSKADFFFTGNHSKG